MDRYGIVFCPFFGALPDHFALWLESCKGNDRFQFIVFTDDPRIWDLPHNVVIEKITFEGFRDFIQERFDFPVSLDTPYKLCDYKPAYGYIFKERIGGYKYWGHCDLDLIFGDIAKFLPHTAYDKLSYLGHFTLYRNCEKVIHGFMEDRQKELSYRDIFSSDTHFAFDEIGGYGINRRFEDNGLTVYPLEERAADIDCYSNNLNMVQSINRKFVTDRKRRVFIYENGCVYGVTCDEDGRTVRREYVYLHFQKRAMKNEVRDIGSARYIILPHRIVDGQSVDRDYIFRHQESKFYPRAVTIKVHAGIRRIQRAGAVFRLKIRRVIRTDSEIWKRQKK